MSLELPTGLSGKPEEFAGIVSGFDLEGLGELAWFVQPIATTAVRATARESQNILNMASPRKKSVGSRSLLRPSPEGKESNT